MAVPGFPFIDTAVLPEEERENARFIEQNLMSLNELCKEFAATLDLFGFARRGYLNISIDQMESAAKPSDQVEPDTSAVLIKKADCYYHWQKIAGRNGAIVIKGFFELLQSINTLVAPCPVLSSLTDKAKRGEGNDIFKSTFPGIHGLRNSVAHPEINSTPTKVEANRLAGPVELPPFAIGDGAGLLLHNTIIDLNGHVQFAATVEGKFVKYDVSETSLHALGAVRNAYWEAFNDAIKLEHRGRE